MNVYFFFYIKLEELGKERIYKCVVCVCWWSLVAMISRCERGEVLIVLTGAQQRGGYIVERERRWGLQLARLDAIDCNRGSTLLRFVIASRASSNNIYTQSQLIRLAHERPPPPPPYSTYSCDSTPISPKQSTQNFTAASKGESLNLYIIL